MSYLSNVADAFRATLTRQWWSELAEASVRQALHVTLPVLVAIQVSGQINGNALKAALVAVLGGEVVVVGRRLLALQAPAGSGPATEYAFRAVSTFAGSVLGSVLAVDAFNVLDAPWGSILTTGVGAVGVALLHGSADGPASMARADSLTVVHGDHETGYATRDGSPVPSQGTATRTLEEALGGPNVALVHPVGVPAQGGQGDPFADDVDGGDLFDQAADDPGDGGGDPMVDSDGDGIPDHGDRGVGSHYPDIDGPAVR